MKEYILYWTNRDGSVGFALDIDNKVQLFTKEEANVYVEQNGLKTVKVGL
jgi:pantoate kinase